MATIDTKKNKKGEIIGYRFRTCVGRDEKGKQVWRTKSIDRPEKLTPKKEQKEVKRQADSWEQKQKEEFELTQTKQDKRKITLSDFIEQNWWKDHVMDGSHTPSSISFYSNMSDDIKDYFGSKIRLNQFNGQNGAEKVKQYIRFLNTEARTKIFEYKEISFTVRNDDESIVLSWETKPGALSYQVFRKNLHSKTYTKLGATKESTYTDIKYGRIKNPTYQVKARYVVPGGEPYSQTTIIRHYQTLRNILNYALRFGYLENDPYIYLTLKDKPKKESKSIDFLPPTEARRFIDCLQNEPLYWRCLENVLITTGLRRGECVGLQWRDIDSEKLTISVSRNVTIDKDAEEGYHVGKTKTGDERTVPISKRLFTMLMSLKSERENELSPKDVDGNIISKVFILPHGYVFSRDGDPYKPVYPTEPTRWTAKFVKKNGLQNVSPHDLRHTAATLALEGGADIKEVQEILGHKDPSTTMQFYVGLTEEAKRRTVEGIESIISK